MNESDEENYSKFECSKHVIWSNFCVCPEIFVKDLINEYEKTEENKANLYAIWKRVYGSSKLNILSQLYYLFIY